MLNGPAPKSLSSMATGFTLPPPPALEIHDSHAFEKWKKLELAWKNYSLASKLHKETEDIQVATLLTIIGEEARDVYSTFTDWNGTKKATTENRPGVEEIC